MEANRTVKRGCREELSAGMRWENASTHQLRIGRARQDCAPHPGRQGPRGSVPQDLALSTGKTHGSCSTKVWVFENPFSWIKETTSGAGK